MMYRQVRWSLSEILRQLVGPIDPVGSVGTDEVRLANLEYHSQITDTLIRQLWEIAHMELNGEASRDEVIMEARKSMKGLGEWFIEEEESDAKG